MLVFIVVGYFYLCCLFLLNGVQLNVFMTVFFSANELIKKRPQIFCSYTE